MFKMFKVACAAAHFRGVLRSSARGSGSLPGLKAELGRPWTRHVHGGHRGAGRSCVVDPSQEETFMFVELTDPEEEPKFEMGADPRPTLPEIRPHQQTPHAARGGQDGPGKDHEVESPIHFHDEDFPLDPSVVASKKKKKKAAAPKGQHKIYGSPDWEEPSSDTHCWGCGSILHCRDVGAPGYLPSEKYKVLLQDKGLSGATCQRCYLLRHHQTVVSVQVSKEQFRHVVQTIRSKRALVLLCVDLLDVPDSVVPDLAELVGANKHVVVLGNKIDLLPGDSPNYLERIKRQLSHYCQEAGFGSQVTDVHLVSAKTGYGIEGLISSLQSAWKYKGDVYLVGSTNAGKSTLFNTLLESDFCKSKTSSNRKATISPWPGTTLNLLKFPIINPTPYRMFRRQKRLGEWRGQTEEQMPPDEVKRLQDFRRQGYLVGRVGRTFLPTVRQRGISFDPDSLAFGENGEEELSTEKEDSADEFTYNELKDAHWLFDTPGIMKEHDVLALLNEQEVKALVSTRAIIPRTFVLKPGMSLFVGALARIDFLQGEQSCWFSVLTSADLPLHLTTVDKALSVYQKHAGHQLLGVPAGGADRMKDFPALVPQEFRLEGRGHTEAVADIKLSSAGTPRRLGGGDCRAGSAAAGGGPWPALAGLRSEDAAAASTRGLAEGSTDPRIGRLQGHEAVGDAGPWTVRTCGLQAES
ncbi:nitric oxide-associated protein 1-like isoform X2 [Nerophis ophidion]|uniref:nitric oxide-associated protein 1-like isoform X2 n=1 Tax=Nerophis ophidion TaxID=159077 RepID=UPI002ADFBDFB|nr:nitric oxide-associated protein 1-like isoform X2 [Nerophis ophidion]